MKKFYFPFYLFLILQILEVECDSQAEGKGRGRLSAGLPDAPGQVFGAHGSLVLQYPLISPCDAASASSIQAELHKTATSFDNFILPDNPDLRRSEAPLPTFWIQLAKGLVLPIISLAMVTFIVASDEILTENSEQAWGFCWVWLLVFCPLYPVKGRYCSQSLKQK